MVKKIIYGGAVAALLTTSAVFAGGPEILPPPVYFQGFYIGGTIGGHAAKADQTANFSSTTEAYEIVIPGPPFNVPITVANNQPVASTDVDGGDINAYGGIQGGANWVWDGRWLLGIVGFWEGSHGLRADSSSNQENSFNSSTTIPGPTTFDVNNTSNVTLSTRTKIGNDWGVAGKLGMLLSPTTLVYAKLGAIWADIESSANVNGSIAGTTDVSSGSVLPTTTVNSITNVSGSTSNSNDEVAFLVGGGLEQYVYSNVVTFFIEYNYAQFSSIGSGPVDVSSTTTATSASGDTLSPTNPVSTVGTISTNTSKVRFNNVLAGFNFYFGQNWL